MPDPVGRTLARLADRVAFLEARLNARQGSLPRPQNPNARDMPVARIERPYSSSDQPGDGHDNAL